MCLAVGLVGLFALLGCQRQMPEQMLREQVAMLHQAIEERRAEVVLEQLSEDFVANNRMDGAAMARYLKLQLLANQRVVVVLGPLEVHVDGDHARVETTAMLAGSSSGWVPERGQLRQIRSYWRWRSDAWELYRIDWDAEGGSL